MVLSSYSRMPTVSVPRNDSMIQTKRGRTSCSAKPFLVIRVYFYVFYIVDEKQKKVSN